MPRIIAQNRIPRTTIGSRSINSRGQLLGAAAATPIFAKTSSGSATWNLPLAPALAGDLVIVSMGGTGGTGTPPAGGFLVLNYTWISFGYKTFTIAKVLTQADINAGVLALTGLNTDGPVIAGCYRGVTQVRIASFLNSVGDPMVLPAFNKSGKMFVAFFQSRDDLSNPLPPFVWNIRIPSLDHGNFMGRLDDLKPADYDGGPVAYTGVGPTGAVGAIYELS